MLFGSQKYAHVLVQGICRNAVDKKSIIGRDVNEEYKSVCVLRIYILKLTINFFWIVVKTFLFLFVKIGPWQEKQRLQSAKHLQKRLPKKRWEKKQPEKPIITRSEPVQRESKFAIDIKTDSTNVPYGKGMYCV